MKQDFTEEVYWNKGFSTRFAKELTPRDIRKFIAQETNARCGRISRISNKCGDGVWFRIRRPFVLTRIFCLKKAKSGFDALQCEKSIFIAYDFNFIYDFEFVVDGEIIKLKSNKQNWIDFMQKKFGEEYEKFMFTYTE